MEKFKTNDFQLIRCIRADLYRAKYLESKKYPSNCLTLWIGIISPRYLPILIFRISYWFGIHRLGIFAKIFSILNTIFFGIEIGIRCRIGGGFYLPHTQGIVIGASSVGENVTIFQGVTLGAKNLDFSYDESLRPSIGDNVIIGAGAKILGGIEVGGNSVIGANAVVLHNIPNHSVASGVPAKWVHSVHKNT